MMIENENEVFEYWFENEILFAKFKEPIHLDLEIGERFLKARHKISNFEKQYWCYDFTNVRSMSKKCREHASRDGQDYLHACAVIVNTHISQFLYNAFLYLKSPKVKFRAFKNKTDAVIWLNELKNESKQR